MMILSTLSISFSITVILEETFAPPMIATNGFSWIFFTIFSLEILILFPLKNPATAGRYFAKVSVDACAR